MSPENKARIAAANRKRCTKHGEGKRGQKTPEYRSWVHMRERCNNPKCARYPLYGGRGISHCDRWNDYAKFLEDMGRRPTLKHSLDRINVNGNYEPGNCRWANQSTQTNNTRRNIVIEHGGETRTLSEWAHFHGVKPDLYKARYYRGDRPPRLFRETDHRYWDGRVSA